MSKSKIVTQIHGIMHQLIKERDAKDTSYDRAQQIGWVIDSLRQAVSQYEMKEIQ